MTPIDIDKALVCIESSARLGQISAMEDLGNKYSSGKKIPKNLHEALYWYSLAAESGHIESTRKAGMCCKELEDWPRALTFLKKAMDHGDPKAINNLIEMYSSGQGVAVDKAEARRLRRIIAEQGYDWAQYLLAHDLHFGTDGPEDQIESTHLYRLSAEQGYLSAMNGLGLRLMLGLGAPADPLAGAEWLLKAARRGQARSMHTLATLYLNGQAGLPRDYGLGYRWLLRARKGYQSGTDPDVNLSALLNLIAEVEAKLAPELIRQWQEQAEHQQIE